MTGSNGLSSTTHPVMPEYEIIFSLRDDYIWVSWPDTNATVRLGRHDTVAAMMEDFLSQDALAKRLGDCSLDASWPHDPA